MKPFPSKLCLRYRFLGDSRKQGIHNPKNDVDKKRYAKQLLFFKKTVIMIKIEYPSRKRVVVNFTNREKRRGLKAFLEE